MYKLNSNINNFNELMSYWQCLKIVKKLDYKYEKTQVKLYKDE